jgi:ABC-type nitrate/sulfonate/bicarbonate transport system ATPase subunit
MNIREMRITIEGPVGCGKSTLMRLLMRLLTQHGYDVREETGHEHSLTVTRGVIANEYILTDATTDSVFLWNLVSVLKTAPRNNSLNAVLVTNELIEEIGNRLIKIANRLDR